MRVVVILVAVWLALSVLGILMYVVGAIFARRSAWEEAYEAGYRRGVQDAGSHPELLIERHPVEGRHA